MNFIEALFVTLTVGIGSFFLSVITFNYIYPNNYQIRDSDSDDEPFEDSGKKEVKLLKTRKLNEEDLEFISAQYLELETEKGNIILKYNVKENGFIYYANYNVQYKTLDAVARKFVLEYDCKELYNSIDFDCVSDISDDDSPQQIRDGCSDSDSLPDINQDDNNDDDDVEDNYNNPEDYSDDEDAVEEDGGSDDEDATEDDEGSDDGDSDDVDDVDEPSHNVFANLKNYKKEALKMEIEEKKINKFIYKGKLEEFRKKTSGPPKDISYTDFKAIKHD